MNLARKQPRREQSQVDSRPAATTASEQVANDGLGDFTLPSVAGIEVKELSREEFEALLAGQGCPV